ncbi:MAG: hypothetical protein GY833_16600 [Aestuariibacter sp.]|nr:hypothetical protein [Aestuariibacter sp.]
MADKLITPDPIKLRLTLNALETLGLHCTPRYLTLKLNCSLRTAHRYLKWYRERRPELFRVVERIDMDEFERDWRLVTDKRTNEKLNDQGLLLKEEKNASVFPMQRPISSAKGLRHVVALFDMHLPGRHGLMEPAAQAAMKYIYDTKPDEVILGGDFITFDSLSSWNAGKPGKLKGLSTSRDLKIGNLVLDMLQQATNKVTWIAGNHERRVQEWVDKHPNQVGDILDIQQMFRLYDRSIDYIPESGFYQIGEARFIHGFTAQKYHAAHTLAGMGTNTFYGHAHDIQSFSQLRFPSGKPIIAQCCGCLCRFDYEYMQRKPTKWVNAFLVIYFNDDGTFNHYLPVMADCKSFVAPNGRRYSA